MRPRLFVLGGALVLLAARADAQIVLQNWVIGSGATASAGNGLVAVGTVAQPVIGPVDGPVVDAWQGFWYTVLPQSTTSVREDYAAGTAEGSVRLHQNVPNPFSSSTEIRIELPHPTHVVLKLYDAVGREVRTLLDGDREAGTITIRAEADQLESGHYTARLVADGVSRSIQMVVVR